MSEPAAAASALLPGFAGGTLHHLRLDRPVPFDVEGRRVAVAAICDDSRAVTQGALFLLLPSACTGYEEGRVRRYCAEARARGAGCLVTVGLDLLLEPGMPHLALASMEQAGALLGRLLGTRDRPPRCIGVTGTDGKSSIVWMVRHALARKLGSAWSLGTLGWMRAADDCLPLDNTTPSLLTLHGVRADAGRAGVGALVCEVSSHGVAQQRIAGIPFSAALWSNLGRDHLEEHGGSERYRALKCRFMQQVAAGGGRVVGNGDHPVVVEELGRLEGACWYRRDEGGAAAPDTLAWSVEDGRRLCLAVAEGSVVVEDVPPAAFHHENLAAAAALLWFGGLAGLDDLPALLSSMPTPTGRMEQVAAGVYIDYAHTPEALAALLASARPLCRGRLLLLFGCGGGRDRAKRARMGEIAACGADALWITEDNPRDEDARAIAEEIAAGVAGRCPCRIEIDRGAAIADALRAKGPEDLLLIAGKGHESYIERDGVRQPWSDADCVRALLRQPPERRWA
ncbi:MAG: UDP-N-acetylmuramyl-tripeptide synthetase [Zetaproteobacteria bacterium]|nr:MAG: UDP-N-acetylmuramyl-tripeptide synthetase [Zetaproteobacteria bacterium]